MQKYFRGMTPTELIETEIYYLIELNLSIRDIAKQIKRSKSAVHNDLSHRIKLYYTSFTCQQVSDKLKSNYDNRGHISYNKYLKRK